MDRTGALLIAEAGVNHNGSLDCALQLVDAAAAAGADIIKFQTFRANRIVGVAAPKATYQLAATGSEQSQYEMLKALELDEGMHLKLASRCAELGIEFLSTPFDLESLRLLVDTVGIKRIKFGSGEITNGPLLLAAARTRKPLILSTGMSTLSEIESALSVLAFGYVSESCTSTSREAFDAAYASSDGRRALQELVTLLHCTTEYPAPDVDVNLGAMDTMSAAFGLPVGYSDHTKGVAISLAAVARGASVLEKHFTLSRNMPGPDHKASLEPDEFRELVLNIRRISAAIGDGRKVPAPSELANKQIARKSLVARVPIAAGEAFTEGNLGAKRPGGGLSPMDYWALLGRTALRDFGPDEMIEI